MMSSLKDRLAAKTRRVATVPVQVSDPGPAREAWAEAERQVILLEVTKGKGLAQAKRDRAKAADVLREHYVEVEFVAGSPADVERILSAHTDDKGEWSIDALPELAALCAADEELQDADWWSDQVANGAWSMGERQDIWVRLLNLNSNIPPDQLPKG